MTTRTTGPAGLADYLLSTGAASPRWADAVRAVPRTGFLPDLYWAFDPDTGRSEPVDRRVDPERWASVAESDTALTVQWDDGDHSGTDPGTVPTSSASQPSVVTAMLEDARLEPGARVLEAGTGTGWSAALTAHVVGPGTVVSIEYDPHVAELAARNLDRGGHHVRLVVGDAAEGWPVDAPYDRVIATYGVRRIPQAWIAQTRPGGLVTAPWGTNYSQRDAVVVLTVGQDGTASGRFTRQVEFMKARGDRLQFPSHDDYAVGDGHTSTARSGLTYRDLVGGRWDPNVFITGLLVPGVTHVVDIRDPVAPTAWFYSLTDRSWAAATFGLETTIVQGGRRDVWAEVEQAVTGWIAAGRPGLERYGLTVRADGTHAVWLDEPGNTVAVHRPR